MAWTATLRREIADEFEAFVPTQWRLLLGGWMFKPVTFWGDDSGEREFKHRVSSSYQWQRGLRVKEVARDNSRCLMKQRRSAKRRMAVKKRARCAGCNTELDHIGYQNVRKYCTPACQELKLRKETDGIKRGEEMRQCKPCGSLFLADRHATKKTCSPQCRKDRTKRLRREKNNTRR